MCDIRWLRDTSVKINEWMYEWTTAVCNRMYACMYKECDCFSTCCSCIYCGLECNKWMNEWMNMYHINGFMLRTKTVKIKMLA